MDVFSWKPTLHVQTSLVVNQVRTFQLVSSKSQIPSYQPIPQPIQYDVNEIQHLQATSLIQPMLPIPRAFQTPLTQPLQGILQPPLFGQVIPKIQVG